MGDLIEVLLGFMDKGGDVLWLIAALLFEAFQLGESIRNFRLVEEAVYDENAGGRTADVERLLRLVCGRGHAVLGPSGHGLGGAAPGFGSKWGGQDLQCRRARSGGAAVLWELWSKRSQRLTKLPHQTRASVM